MSRLAALQQASASSSHASLCSACQEPLFLSNEDFDGPTEVPDEVQLSCSHKYHWECIMSHAVEHAEGRSNCGVCGSNVLNAEGKFLVVVRNEGGTTTDFDLGSEIADELEFEANPEARRNATFLSLMDDGELEAAETFLRGEDGEGNGRGIDLASCYDKDGLYALHLCAINNDVPGIQFLLRHGFNHLTLTQNEDQLAAIQLAHNAGSKEAFTLLNQL